MDAFNEDSTLLEASVDEPGDETSPMLESSSSRSSTQPQHKIISILAFSMRMRDPWEDASIEPDFNEIRDAVAQHGIALRSTLIRI